MNSIELVTQQRQKEGKNLQLLLVSSLLGSLASHALILTLQVGNIWDSIPQLDTADEIEVTVESLPEDSPKEELIAEVPPEPEVPQDVAFTSETPPPLAPASQTPLPTGEDAPSPESPSPSTDPVTPLTSQTGDIPTAKTGIGSIFSPDSKGSGFGNALIPTGFVPAGKPEGKPEGKPRTAPSQAVVSPLPPSLPPPIKAKQPTCVSCPKPKYQGAEASPRVDMKIRPDGSVEVRLRKSSGNPDVDRATLETMSKWQFDPQTVPENGVQKRVRVTYEEDGSSFQRQNAERRRQEAQRQQETERLRLVEEKRQDIPTTADRPTAEKISPTVSPATSTENNPDPTPTLSTPSVEAPLPPPPPPEPAPVEAPPPPPPEPAPVEAPPPPPPEPAPVETSSP